MQFTFQLIQIVSDPVNKNCWLDVEKYPDLKAQFSALIQDYDFIDFEGQVYYYNVLNKLPVNDEKAFEKRFESVKIISHNEGLDDFLACLAPESKQIVLSSFVENEAVILIA